MEHTWNEHRCEAYQPDRRGQLPRTLAHLVEYNEVYKPKHDNRKETKRIKVTAGEQVWSAVDLLFS